MAKFTLQNTDCLPFLRSLADKSVDAVIADPPYGIKADEAASKNNGKWGWKYYGETAWDKERPQQEVFSEILRVSKYQIIWGGNYFADLLPPSMGWLAWDKGQRNFSLADFELAWTSIQSAARFVSYSRGRANQEKREHPTQKPLQVMLWCLAWLDKYGKNINTVLDPFMGSGSTGVACMQYGKEFTGIEIDKKYYAIAERRISEAASQGILFAKSALTQRGADSGDSPAQVDFYSPE